MQLRLLELGLGLQLLETGLQLLETGLQPRELGLQLLETGFQLLELGLQLLEPAVVAPFFSDRGDVGRVSCGWPVYVICWVVRG